MLPFDLVIWDWNGTLLDDRWLCLEVVNGMLDRRELPTIDEERYLDIFQFPIVEYYRRVGFDFDRDPFPELAVEYLSEYDSRVGECALHDGAESTIRTLAEHGIQQAILSASRQGSLEDAVRTYGIEHWFTTMRGLPDGHAVSKVSAGKELIASLAVEPARAIMIGDTDHDGEVADALGVGLVLVASGHQSYSRLSTTGRHVIASFGELTAWLEKKTSPPSGADRRPQA